MMFTRAPDITTARLLLRELRPDDLDPIHAMWREPKVYEFITGRPATREESWSGILRYNGHWNLLGYGYWAVEEGATRRVIGQMGFADFKREIEPPLEGTPELGWALATACHGQGYATEALKAITDWGDRNLAEQTTACIVSPGNVASVQVAAKIGFNEVARTTYKGDATILFQRERPAGV
jgi:predicted CxxxxCH...CXXCH cytochrome family protein